jgi:hypothetical protein
VDVVFVVLRLIRMSESNEHIQDEANQRRR